MGFCSAQSTHDICILQQTFQLSLTDVDSIEEVDAEEEKQSGDDSPIKTSRQFPYESDFIAGLLAAISISKFVDIVFHFARAVSDSAVGDAYL